MDDSICKVRGCDTHVYADLDVCLDHWRKQLAHEEHTGEKVADEADAKVRAKADKKAPTGKKPGRPRKEKAADDEVPPPVTGVTEAAAQEPGELPEGLTESGGFVAGTNIPATRAPTNP